MSGPTLIAKVLSKASKTIMGKHKSRARLSMARLIDNWAEIIAPEDPTIVRPIRIGWRWQGEGAERISEGTLHIAAPSALATKISYQESIIVGRVNRLFGMPANNCLKKINLSHDRVAAPPTRRTRIKGDVASDTQTQLSGVHDPVLRARLTSLAEAMVTTKRE